jgi:hypothetical protein
MTDTNIKVAKVVLEIDGVHITFVRGKYRNLIRIKSRLNPHTHKPDTHRLPDSAFKATREMAAKILWQ